MIVSTFSTAIQRLHFPRASPPLTLFWTLHRGGCKQVQCSPDHFDQGRNHLLNWIWSLGQKVNQGGHKMSMRQTYSCFLVLLILLNKEITPLEVNQGSQGPSLFTTRLEELWQTHDHFCPRCDETSTKDICHPAEKFLPSDYNHQTSSLEADLLFGHPFGPSLVKMRDNSCVIQTFYLGAPVGIAAFFKRGNLLWLREAGVQWSRRSLGPIVSCPTRYITYNILHLYHIYHIFQYPENREIYLSNMPGPVVWFEQQVGGTRLLLASVEGVEAEVAVARLGAGQLYTTINMDRVTQKQSSDLKTLPHLEFVVQRDTREIPVGKNLVSIASSYLVPRTFIFHSDVNMFHISLSQVSFLVRILKSDRRLLTKSSSMNRQPLQIGGTW